jgi:hypothetical protein
MQMAVSRLSCWIRPVRTEVHSYPGVLSMTRGTTQATLFQAYIHSGASVMKDRSCIMFSVRSIYHLASIISEFIIVSFPLEMRFTPTQSLSPSYHNCVLHVALAQAAKRGIYGAIGSANNSIDDTRLCFRVYIRVEKQCPERLSRTRSCWSCNGSNPGFVEPIRFLSIWPLSRLLIEPILRPILFVLLRRMAPSFKDSVCVDAEIEKRPVITRARNAVA